MEWATGQPAGPDVGYMGGGSAGVRKNGCWTPPPFPVEGGGNNNETMKYLGGVWTERQMN